MKCKEYLEDLVDKFGEDYAIQSIKNAISHHSKINEIEPNQKSVTTIRFFKNCLALKEPQLTIF